MKSIKRNQEANRIEKIKAKVSFEIINYKQKPINKNKI